MNTSLTDIVSLLDSTLRIRDIKDASVAMNGLQVENNGCVTKVALGVDGSQKTIDDAIAAGADLLVLHHGIFWCGLQPVTLAFPNPPYIRTYLIVCNTSTIPSTFRYDKFWM